MSEVIRKKIRFYGQVQGVGFRYRARIAASSLGVTGWVHNEYDGSVSMEIQGTEAQIDEVILSVPFDAALCICKSIPDNIQL